VGVLWKGAVEALHVLVEHGVTLDRIFEVGEFLGRGQLALDQQIRDFQEVALVGEFFDGNAAVAENSLVAVDEGDRALGRPGIGVAGIESYQAGVGTKLSDVDRLLALGTYDDR